MLFIISLTLPIALLIGPWLLSRNLLLRADFTTTLAAAGPCLIALSTGIMAFLHCTHTPIKPASLAIAHITTALALFLITRWRAIPFASPSHYPPAFFTSMFLLFAILVIPFTHIAGIDTYKWQDLASAVQVEGSIPWLIHPSSLFGFTPRSYPSAQPLLLATISTISGFGVDWSFYILSILCGLMAIASSFALGRHLFPASTTPALWLTFLYVLSPVFLRYNYWATGRGLFMALLPVFILALMKARRWLGIFAILSTATLLALSHKTGLAAIIVIPLLFLLSSVIYKIPFIKNRHRAQVILFSCLLLLTLATGFLLADHSLTQFLLRITTRLAFLAPLSLAGILLAPQNDNNPAATFTVKFTALATLPLVFTSDMYGSMIASLFISGLAAIGISATYPLPPLGKHPLLPRTTVALTLLVALVIIIHQTADSPSRDVVRAARFLEKHDPLGPYRLEAPGLTRTRMQAYLSGCPRFTATASPHATLQIQKPLPLTGNLHVDSRTLTHYLRKCLQLSDASTDWYGSGNKVYYVTIDGKGVRPPDAKHLFTSGTVTIYE
jgi:hypothetical protein